MSSIYGKDWRILACEGCGELFGDNVMGGLHLKCPQHPNPGVRKEAPAFRRRPVVEAVPVDCLLSTLNEINVLDLDANAMREHVNRAIAEYRAEALPLTASEAEGER